MRWFDQPSSALNDRCQEFESEGFFRCEFSDGGVILFPPEDSRRSPVMVDVVYSENREQYRATSVILTGRN